MHDLSHCGRQGCRLTRSAQGERHCANYGKFLLPGRVYQRLDVFALAHVLGIGDDAYYLDLTLADADMLTEHVSVREKLLRESLIDDGYLRRPLVVLRREGSPPEQGDFHRGEIVFADHFLI